MHRKLKMLQCLSRRKNLALLLAIVLLSLYTLVYHVFAPQRSAWPWSRQKPGQFYSQASPSKFFSHAADLSARIVVARNNEDTSWLDIYLGRIPHIVYQVVDANAEFTTAVNKGKEAMPYLQYIIDHYNDLPDVSVFTHGAMYASDGPAAYHASMAF